MLSTLLCEDQDNNGWAWHLPGLGWDPSSLPTGAQTLSLSLSGKSDLSRVASMLPARVPSSRFSSHLTVDTYLCRDTSWAPAPSPHQAMAGSILSEAGQLTTDLPQPSPPQQPWFVSHVSIFPSVYLYERKSNFVMIPYRISWKLFHLLCCSISFHRNSIS